MAAEPQAKSELGDFGVISTSFPESTLICACRKGVSFAKLFHFDSNVSGPELADSTAKALDAPYCTADESIINMLESLNAAGDGNPRDMPTNFSLLGFRAIQVSNVGAQIHQSGGLAEGSSHWPPALTADELGPQEEVAILRCKQKGTLDVTKGDRVVVFCTSPVVST